MRCCFYPSKHFICNNLWIHLETQTLCDNITMEKCVLSNSKQQTYKWIFETQPISVSFVVIVHNGRLWNRVYHSWPLNNTGSNCAGPLTHRFFSINTSIQSTVHIPRFCILRFNQLWTKNSILDLQLGICKCWGRTICILLCHFI